MSSSSSANRLVVASTDGLRILAVALDVYGRFELPRGGLGDSIVDEWASATGGELWAALGKDWWLEGGEKPKGGEVDAFLPEEVLPAALLELKRG